MVKKIGYFFMSDKFLFNHQWNEAWLIVLNMVYTSFVTRCRTTQDLGCQETKKCQEICKLHRIIPQRPVHPPKMDFFSKLAKNSWKK